MSQTLQLTIQDLIMLKNFVSMACDRGAFRAEEMSTIGATYDKLSDFLNSAISQAESQADQIQQTAAAEHKAEKHLA